MPDYAGEPVTIQAGNVRDAFGNQLDETNAAGAVSIWNDDMTEQLVVDGAMPWRTADEFDPPLVDEPGRFVYDWIPPAAGVYLAKVTITPTAGYGSFEWRTITIVDRPVPGPPPSQWTSTAWAQPDDVPGADEYDQDRLVEYLQFATEVLYLLTGKVWPGVTTDKIWPGNRRRTHGPRHRHATVGQHEWQQWRWVTIGCGCGSDEFGCHRVPSVALPGRPVVEILEVVVNGAVIDPATYEVQNGNLLVRLADSDGNNPGWPCCQRADLEDGAEGTWSIEYRYGAAPPIGGKLSAVSLATELAKAYKGDGGCRLPKRVTAITRQGTTVAILDPLTLFEKGQTGLSDVDLWLGSLRAGKGRQQAVFGNPESILRRGVRRRRPAG